MNIIERNLTILYVPIYFVVGNMSVKSCEGTIKYGSVVYIDFKKINRPCTCTVTSFGGNIFMTASEQQISSCTTQVKVDNMFIFGCPIKVSGQTLSSSVYLESEYVHPYTSGLFYQCLGFQQKGNFNYL